jgi:hypothetical protein
MSGVRPQLRQPASLSIVVGALLTVPWNVSALTTGAFARPSLAALPSRSMQPATVDVGSFTMYLNNDRAGREQFSIQQVATIDGSSLALRAESAVGDRRSAMQLETDSLGTPTRYSIEDRVGTTVTLRLGGQRVRGRFTTLARSTTGEAAREYLLVPGALVIEDFGVVQYALMIRRRLMGVGDSVAVPILTPSANRQGVVQLSYLTRSDTVSIAGSRRAAHRWQVRSEAGEIRLLWADDEGRLLRFEVPSRRFVAVRDDVPR